MPVNLSGNAGRISNTVDSIGGTVVNHVSDDDENEKLIAEYVTSDRAKATDIFLISSKSVKSFQKKYPNAGRTGTTCFTAGVVFHGSWMSITSAVQGRHGGGSKMIPFEVLHKISDASDHSVHQLFRQSSFL